MGEKGSARSDDEDAQLMLRYARGELPAFESLYARHRQALYRYLMRHTRHADTANDLFQDVWSNLIASRERYQPRAKFRTFLYTLAHNCFIDHCRRSAARPQTDGAINVEDAIAAPTTTQPDRHAEDAQMLTRYRGALAQLPAEQRDAFLLYEESGLSLEDIARITGVGAETAKSRMRYAVNKLRQALEGDAPPARGARAEGRGP
ncbi:MAG TPA: RNA polymerase sigma factor [Steroidobacteraceae bacterium]